jgi:hypothetical protein
MGFFPETHVNVLGPQHVRPQYSPDPKFPFVPFDFPDATSASANKFADVDYTKLDNSVKGVCPSPLHRAIIFLKKDVSLQGIMGDTGYNLQQSNASS